MKVAYKRRSLGNTIPADNPVTTDEKRAFLVYVHTNRVPIYLGNTLVKDPQDPFWGATQQQFVDKYISWRMRYAETPTTTYFPAETTTTKTTDTTDSGASEILDKTNEFLKSVDAEQEKIANTTFAEQLKTFVPRLQAIINNAGLSKFHAEGKILLSLINDFIAAVGLSGATGRRVRIVTRIPRFGLGTVSQQEIIDRLNKFFTDVEKSQEVQTSTTKIVMPTDELDMINLKVQNIQSVEDAKAKAEQAAKLQDAQSKHDPSKSNKGLIIGAGVIAAFGIGAGVYYATRPKKRRRKK